MSELSIKTSDRACFFGRTGSGKTTLARSLLRLARRTAVLDAKHTYRENDTPIVKSYHPKLARQIIRVPFDHERERWREVIDAAWRDRNRILYIDEGTLVNPSRTVASDELGKAIRTGRELNLGLWFGSQRPKEIPSVVFTEADHFFVFKLQYEADREKVASFTDSRMERIIERLQGHEFVYYNVATGTWRLMELKLHDRKRGSQTRNRGDHALAVRG